MSNPDSLGELFAIWAEDYRSHGREWSKPGFRAVAVHRFGVWRMSIRNRVLRAPMSILYRFLFRYVRNRYGIELPYSVRLGRCVVFEHQSGIVIHGASVIGDRCVIRQNCTLGIKNVSDPSAAPVLADGVDVGAGAVILGKVRIGRNAVVGANAVVLGDVPDESLAVGVPAKVLPRRTQ